MTLATKEWTISLFKKVFSQMDTFIINKFSSFFIKGNTINPFLTFYGAGYSIEPDSVKISSTRHDYVWAVKFRTQVTNFNKAVVTFRVPPITSGNYGAKIGYSTNANVNGGWVNCFTNSVGDTYDSTNCDCVETFELDISSLTGYYNIGFGIATYAAVNPVYILDFHLE